jgi:DNA-binding GntR family transcriptional regulator
MLEANAEPGKSPRKKPSRKISQTDLIVRDVIRGLHEGRFIPGQRLVEVDLMATYGTSRGVIREAFNRLAASGVVQLNRHKGASIRALSRRDLQNILVLLEVLLGLAARLAAERIGLEGNRQRMEAATAELLRHEAASSSFDLVRARDMFYQTLLEIGGNGDLQRVLAGMHVSLVRVQVRSDDLELRRFQDYSRISQAVLKGDGRQAEAACRRHVLAVAKALEALPERAFSRHDT